MIEKNTNFSSRIFKKPIVKITTIKILQNVNYGHLIKL
jgi:hypothetical protein